MSVSVKSNLGHWDENGFLFKQEMLKGDFSYSINFDSICLHKLRGFLIFEFLLCEEHQAVNPLTSHPNNYWKKNAMKFIRLFEIAKKLSATLYLVNYAKSGTKHQDKVLVIKVLDLCETKGIVKEQNKQFTRVGFSEWIRKINKECK